MFKLIALMLLAVPAWGFQDSIYKGNAATYMASATVTPGTAPTDICVIGGATGKVVRIHRIALTTTQSTAGINNWFLVKRSNKFPVYTTQGTSMTAVPLDLQMVSSSASSVTLSTNASSLGTLVGNLAVAHVLAPAPAGTSIGPIMVWDFDKDPRDALPTLNKSTDTIAVNFNGASLPSGLSVDCSFIYTEE